MPFVPQVPNANVYGVIPQAYAQSLANTTGDPTADAVNRLNLGMLARMQGGNGSYLDAIRQANELGAATALQEERIKGANSRDVAYLQNIGAAVGKSIGRGIQLGPDSQLGIDPTVIALGDASALQGSQAENLQKLGAGAKSLADAGVAPPTDYIRGVMTPPPAQELAPPVTTGYISANDQAKNEIEREKAKADMITANAARTRAANGEGSNTQTTTTYIVGQDGTPVPMSVEVKRKGSSGLAARAKDDDASPNDKDDKNKNKSKVAPTGLQYTITPDGKVVMVGK